MHSSQALYTVNRNRQISSSRRELREAKFTQIKLLLQVFSWGKKKKKKKAFFLLAIVGKQTKLDAEQG